MIERSVASKQPRFQAGVYAAVLMLLFCMLPVLQGCSSSRESSSNSAIPPGDIAFLGMQLRRLGTEGSYEAVGRLSNRSLQHTLREITITFTMEDAAPQGGAEVVASRTVVMRHEILPGQSEHVREQVSFGSLPKPKGRYEWNYSITAINGVSVPPPGKEGGR